jgi:hypothetical protein
MPGGSELVIYGDKRWFGAVDSAKGRVSCELNKADGMQEYISISEIQVPCCLSSRLGVFGLD